MKLELFHLVADGASARVRKRIVELGVETRVSFRNVHFESHQQALAALANAQGRSIQAAATPAVTQSSTPVAPQSDNKILEIRQHLQRYRELTSQGKLSEAGRELEAIDGLTRR